MLFHGGTRKGRLGKSTENVNISKYMTESTYFRGQIESGRFDDIVDMVDIDDRFDDIASILRRYIDDRFDDIVDIDDRFDTTRSISSISTILKGKPESWQETSVSAAAPS